MYAEILFLPTCGFWEANVFQKLTIHVARATNQTQRFGQKSYEM